jgi:hypothetical protein
VWDGDSKVHGEAMSNCVITNPTRYMVSWQENEYPWNCGNSTFSSSTAMEDYIARNMKFWKSYSRFSYVSGGNVMSLVPLE